MHISVFPIRNERQYEQALDTLSDLLDIVNDDETHPLYNLLDTLGVLVHSQSQRAYGSSAPTPASNICRMFFPST
jgi:HTH-type transcriptional regulator/antitoxin HigA